MVTLAAEITVGHTCSH